MKSYPKIEYFNKGLFGQYCYAFNKLDGSNIQFSFSKKKGWYKFGTRNVMINESSEPFGQAIPLFMNKYADELERVFKTKDYRNSESFIIFGEFYGENSFAGRHIETDKKDITIFDVSVYKKGFVPPREFINSFGHIGIPEVIYQGEYNMDIINSIRNNIYGLSEGVVAKGIYKTKGLDQIWMTKIKTNDWLKKVKSIMGEEALLEELNNDKSLLI